MRKDRQVLSLDFTRWEEGDMNNYLLVKLWDQCVGEVYKNKQRRISHGVRGRKTEHLDQEKGQKNLIPQEPAEADLETKYKMSSLQQ